MASTTPPGLRPPATARRLLQGNKHAVLRMPLLQTVRCKVQLRTKHLTRMFETVGSEPKGHWLDHVWSIRVGTSPVRPCTPSATKQLAGPPEAIKQTARHIKGVQTEKWGLGTPRKRAVSRRAATKGAGVGSRFRRFEDARAFMWDQKLQSKAQWAAWCKQGNRPPDIPSHPDTAYRSDWLSWADWLGHAKGRLAKNYFLPFAEAREVVRAVGMTSQVEWREWCRDGQRPLNVPSAPHRTYKDEGWLSWADWLGFAPGAPPRNEFLPFEEARAFARELSFKSKRDWIKWCQEGRRPPYIPWDPFRTYRDDGWLSWGDWLGHRPGHLATRRRPAKEFRAFEAARETVRQQSLLSKVDFQHWRATGECPEDIPSSPDDVYRDKGWLSWADWLGYGEGQGKRTEFLPFDEARAQVRAEGLTSQRDWTEWCQHGHRPTNIPFDPFTHYRSDGWLSWADWLGYGEGMEARNKFLPFREARTVIRAQGLQSVAQWKEWCRDGNRPANVPSNPNITYHDGGWKSWLDWLGYDEESNSDGEEHEN